MHEHHGKLSVSRHGADDRILATLEVFIYSIICMYTQFQGLSSTVFAAGIFEQLLLSSCACQEFDTSIVYVQQCSESGLASRLSNTSAFTSLFTPVQLIYHLSSCDTGPLAAAYAEKVQHPGQHE